MHAGGSRASSIWCRDGLDDAAVRAVGSQMAWLIEEPDPSPFFQDHAQIFRSVDQLFSPSRLVAAVNRQDAARIRNERDSQDRSQNQPAHHTTPSLSVSGAATNRGAVHPSLTSIIAPARRCPAGLACRDAIQLEQS